MNRDFERKIDLIVEFLKKYGIVDEGIFTFIKTLKVTNHKIVNFYYIFFCFKYYLRFIPHDSIDENKIALIQHLEVFKEDKIIKADEKIIILSKDIIKDNDTIMTFGYSSIVSRLLIKEFKSGKKIQVISVDNYPFNEGRLMNEHLLKAGVPCIYTVLNSVPKFMPKVSKVLVGSSCVLVNGFCLSRVGTAMVF